MLSKNSASSRAIPTHKLLKMVEENPFIPIAWQKEHKGMQGSEYFTDMNNDIPHLNRMWLCARDNAINTAKYLNLAFENEDGSIEGATKQLCNRLLEPFMWTTMLITGSKEGWDNFFSLRMPEYHYGHEVTSSKKEMIKLFKNGMYEGYTDNLRELESYTNLDWLQLNKGQAEIHMMALAEAIWDATNEHTPKQLKAGEWHIPFEDKIDEIKLEFTEENFKDTIQGYFHYTPISKIKISTAMSARTSYTIVGDKKGIDYEEMIKLHDRLINQNPLHASPMEHCARAMSEFEYNMNIKGEANDYDIDGNAIIRDDMKGWCRNFKGFIQYRHIIENYKLHS